LFPPQALHQSGQEAEEVDGGPADDFAAGSIQGGGGSSLGRGGSTDGDGGSGGGGGRSLGGIAVGGKKGVPSLGPTHHMGGRAKGVGVRAKSKLLHPDGEEGEQGEGAEEEPPGTINPDDWTRSTLALVAQVHAERAYAANRSAVSGLSSQCVMTQCAQEAMAVTLTVVHALVSREHVCT
jgi:hypothetical protein